MQNAHNVEIIIVIYPFINNHDDRTHHAQWKKTWRIYQTNKKNEQQL